jgi:hypothetical protein
MHTKLGKERDEVLLILREAITLILKLLHSASDWKGQ